MEVFHGPDFEKELKSDNSPVTIADKRANDFICEKLQIIYSDIPIISEEGELAPYETRKHWKSCFIIDPLDGTKAFIKREDYFTVNIAYVVDGKPIEGVVYAPVSKDIYYTHGGCAYKNDDLLPMPRKHESFRVVTSKSHINAETLAYIEKLKLKHPKLETIAIGSSLKLCHIAEGSADFYPRLGPTSEWDIAAAQAVVEQAGGRVLKLDTDEPLVYNKEDILNPWFAVNIFQKF